MSSLGSTISDWWTETAWPAVSESVTTTWEVAATTVEREVDKTLKRARERARELLKDLTKSKPIRRNRPPKTHGLYFIMTLGGIHTDFVLGGEIKIP